MYRTKFLIKYMIQSSSGLNIGGLHSDDQWIILLFLAKASCYIVSQTMC